MVSLKELKTNLKLNGIETDSITDDDLQSLITLKTNELISLTGIPINPVSRKYVNPNFKGNLLELDYYPINSIHALRINKEHLKEHKDYIMDEDAGIIYLHKSYAGLLVVEYIQQVTFESQNQINPLIMDMILYSLKNKDNDKGAISSVRESEQSINYDTSTSLGNRIYTRIDSLKATYNSSRVKWLG